jgi:regulator of RNase E activity RraA
VFSRHASPPPPDPRAIEALLGAQTSTLGHLRDYGFPRGLTPIRRPLRFAGPAVTVRIPHLDSTAVHVAIDELRPGDVLVVDQSGDDSRSCFGGMVSYAAAARGAAGAVIAGAINDVEEIRALGLPVYSRGVAAHTTRIAGVEGAINVPVTIGGAVVHPGDIVWADSDGIAIVDPEEALDLAAILHEKEAAEPALREELDRGGSLAAHSGAREVFEAAGVNAPELV